MSDSSRAVDPQGIKNSIQMLKQHLGEEEITPLLAVMEALVEDPHNKTLVEGIDKLTLYRKEKWVFGATGDLKQYWGGHYRRRMGQYVLSGVASAHTPQLTCQYPRESSTSINRVILSKRRGLILRSW